MRNREEAAKAAEATIHNEPGYCQLVTRDWFDAPSAGDVDKDGDFDAVDGWKSEPIKYRHTDKNPPRGVPVAFSGGSNGFGHRAISLGNGKIRSTDMSATGYNAGHVGTTTIDQIQRSMGVTYTGWSETMDGILIPNPTVIVKSTRVSHARKLLEDALVIAQKRDSKSRVAKIKSALDILPKR